MNCYVCNSEEELSAKKIDKNGNITFICKSCRREAYERNKPQKQSQRRVSAGMTAKEWRQLARETNGALLLKYRDESFLRAKGLL